jgi:hypothetical protein
MQCYSNLHVQDAIFYQVRQGCTSSRIYKSPSPSSSLRFRIFKCLSILVSPTLSIPGMLKLTYLTFSDMLELTLLTTPLSSHAES